MARPRSFEKSDVLGKAMNLFWEQGYSGTSIEELGRRTDLNPGSLYSTFGDKQSLFKEVLDYYCDTVISGRLEILNRDDAIERRVHDFLRDVASQSLDRNEISGCLLTNSSFELPVFEASLQDEIRERVIEFEDTFNRVLVEARKQHELRSDCDTRRLARFLVGVIQGMNVIGRTLPAEGRLEDMIELALETILLYRKDDS